MRRAVRWPHRARSFDISRVQASSDRVAPCTPSVLCDAAWRTEAGAVVAIYAINQAQGAMGLCTGTHPKLLSLCKAQYLPLHTKSKRERQGRRHGGHTSLTQAPISCDIGAPCTNMVGLLQVKKARHTKTFCIIS